MLKTYINEYKYNQDIFKSRLEYTLNKTLIKTSFINTFFIILVLIVIIFYPIIFDYIYLCLIIIIQIINVLYKHIIINRQMKKFNKMYNDMQINYIIDFKKKVIIQNNNMQMSFTNLKSISQNKIWIVLNNKKGPDIFLKKDSFIKGNNENCYNELKKYIKENKHND